jgi:ribosomal protein S12 methylthiotransferase
MADSRYSNVLVPYLDVPFQHAHPDVLRRMKRPANGERNLERIQAWRALLPNLTVRSTFIAGFPGETESEFQAVLDFLTAAELDRVGCFAYSPVEGATANALSGAVPSQLREERRDRLMAHQADISSKRLARRVGAQERVLIDELVWLVGDEDSDDAPGEPTAIARSTADAPEIDGVVRVTLSANQMRELRVGQFIDVTILAADEHDLEGRIT